MLVNGLVILFDRIPFIYCNNNPLTTVMGDPCDLRILLCHAFCRINHNHDNIRTLNCRHGTDDAVALELFFYFILATKARCINKDILPVLPCHRCVDCIARCPGNI